MDLVDETDALREYLSIGEQALATGHWPAGDKVDDREFVVLCVGVIRGLLADGTPASLAEYRSAVWDLVHRAKKP